MAQPMLEAVVCHVTRGRARLRFPRLLGRAGLLQQVALALGGHADVDEVRMNSRTGSLLVLHRNELAPILAYAHDNNLFEVVRQIEHAPMRRIEAAIADMDQRLARETNGAFSLGTATFISLVAAGLYQLRQGKLLPAGMTLFNYALDVMQREANREARDLPRRPRDVSVS